MNPVPRLAVTRVSKAYEGVQALVDVSLSVGPGEVHGLIGENGAGKSTLIKVLAGNVRPDEGAVCLDGADLRLGDVVGSEASGVSVIHQEPAVFPDLGVEDNIFVGREPRGFPRFVIDRLKRRQETQNLLASLGEDLPLGVPLSDLSVAQRQMVAIARALSVRCRLMVMDEPTASLSAKEVVSLTAVVRRLKESGVSVLYVSHRLEEVLDLTDRVTVLRDGRVVARIDTPSATREQLVASMVGRDLGQGLAAEREPIPAGNAVLEARGLTRGSAVQDVSFDVRAGEVLGLGGLVGAGRSEVARILFGIDRQDAGTVRVNGRELRAGSTCGAIRAGIALVPEDRQHQGLVLPLSVAVNLVMAVRERLAVRGWVRRRAESLLAKHMVSQLGVKAASPEVPASSLSGGNQQKVVIGKWLATEPQVLILDEPTRGIDVGAKAEVHRLVRSLAQAGKAVLLVTSDLPELLALSDRIIVMREGRVAGSVSGHSASEQAVMDLAVTGGAG